MKKFAKIDGQWFWICETIEDVDYEFAQTLTGRLAAAVKGDMYTDVSKRNVRADFIERLHAVLWNGPDYAGSIAKYGRPIAIRRIGSYMAYNPKSVTEFAYLDDFPPENRTGEVVICENDLSPDNDWLQWCTLHFPSKEIQTLNLFSTRTPKQLDSELDVPIISFSTTFTSYDWFELILDTVIRNGWTGKSIIGYCNNKSGWRFPIHISEKIQAIESNGNTFTKIKELT